MKVEPKPEQQTESVLSKSPTITDKIVELIPACPFDLFTFYKDNKGLVKKYLRKDTFDVKVDDWTDIPDSWWYKNREGILRHGVKGKEYSSLQKLEWIKCGLNIKYFTRKYIKIISLDEGLINFKLYDYQEDLLDLYENNRFIISMQARQSGKTQTTAAFATHYLIFNTSKMCAILAQLAGQAQEILERIQLSYEELPLWIQPGVRVYNKRSFTLSNNSKVLATSSTSTSVRGKAISLLYIDECAFLRNDMEFYESTYPTIASGKTTRVIITSTPNGMRGLFYKLWKESEEGLNSFVRMTVTWDMVPGRDEEWKREAIRNTSEEQFRQEHNCIFRGSQNSLLSGQTLERLVTMSPKKIHENGLKIYYPPNKGDREKEELPHEYIITVDVSRGLGNDYHAFSVIDISTAPHEVVATYRNNTLSPLLYPSIIKNVADNYNGAFVLVELNDLGEQVSNILWYDLEYENMLCTVKDKTRQTIGFGPNMQYGVKTSAPVKASGCSTIKTMIENDEISLNDETIIDEFGTLVPHGKSYAADDGTHDDLAMTMILYGWAITQPFFVDLTNQDARKRLLDQIGEDREEEVMPFGFIESNEFGSFGEMDDLGEFAGSMAEDPETLFNGF